MTRPIKNTAAIRLLIAHSKKTGLPWSAYIFKIKKQEREVRLISGAFVGSRVYKGIEQYYIRGSIYDVRATMLWSFFIEKEYSKRFIKVPTKFQIENGII